MLGFTVSTIYYISIQRMRVADGHLAWISSTRRLANPQIKIDTSIRYLSFNSVFEAESSDKRVEEIQAKSIVCPFINFANARARDAWMVGLVDGDVHRNSLFGWLRAPNQKRFITKHTNDDGLYVLENKYIYKLCLRCSYIYCLGNKWMMWFSIIYINICIYI